ncbi:hypothetical protein OROMI_023665 [Orobanche minor]
MPLDIDLNVAFHNIESPPQNNETTNASLNRETNEFLYDLNQPPHFDEYEDGVDLNQPTCFDEGRVEAEDDEDRVEAEGPLHCFDVVDNTNMQSGLAVNVNDEHIDTC